MVQPNVNNPTSSAENIPVVQNLRLNIAPPMCPEVVYPVRCRRCSKHQEKLSGGKQYLAHCHVCGVLRQRLRGLFERETRLYLRLQFSGQERLDLPCDAQLADESAATQPCAEPEAFHVLAFKNQG